MYRYFKKTDGLTIVLDLSYVIGVEDMGDFRIILTPHFEFEVSDTIEDIFDDKKKFSLN
jgi:hypothetical protein